MRTSGFQLDHRHDHEPLHASCQCSASHSGMLTSNKNIPRYRRSGEPIRQLPVSVQRSPSIGGSSTSESLLDDHGADVPNAHRASCRRPWAVGELRACTALCIRTVCVDDDARTSERGLCDSVPVTQARPMQRCRRHAVIALSSCLSNYVYLQTRQLSAPGSISITLAQYLHSLVIRSHSHSRVVWRGCIASPFVHRANR